MHTKTIFLTGITGFLGCHLAIAFLKQGARIVALVRDSSKQMSARQRAINTLQKADDTLHIDTKNLIVLSGDMADPPEKWVHDTQADVKETIDEVWHCAVSFSISKKAKNYVEAVNIKGVEKIVEYVVNINGPDQKPRLFHISTAYSQGRSQDIVQETIKKDVNYRSLYEWAKHQGECVIKAMQKKYDLDVCIFRPSIIVGSLKTKMLNLSGYYNFLRELYLLTKKFEINLGDRFDRNIHSRFKCDPQISLNIVPIDFVVNSMVMLACDASLQSNTLKIFNIVNEKPPTLGFVIKMQCESLNISGFDLVDDQDFERTPMSNFEEQFEKNILFQASYCRDNISFSSQKLRQKIDLEKLPVPDVDAGFLKSINQYFLQAYQQTFI